MKLAFNNIRPTNYHPEV